MNARTKTSGVKRPRRPHIDLRGFPDAQSNAERWLRRLAGNLREQRQHAGLSVFELARRADVSAFKLSLVERAEAWPTLRWLLAITNSLGITMTEILP